MNKIRFVSEVGKKEDPLIYNYYVVDSTGVKRKFEEGDLMVDETGAKAPIFRYSELVLGQRVDGSNMEFVYSFNDTLLADPTIVFMGSSTSISFGLPSNQTIEYKLQQHANAEWGGATIVNIGGGDAQWSEHWLPTAQGGDVIHNIDKALSYNPQFILLFGPTNNAAHTTKEKWLADLQTIVQYARERGAMIFLMSPGPRTPFNSTEQTYLSDSAALQLAAFPYLMYDAFNSPLRTTGGAAVSNPTYYQGDLTHLNDAGTTLLTDTLLIPILERELRPNTAYKNFIIEKSSDGVSGFTVFDTITDQQLISKTYTKEYGFFRAKATLKDNTALPYSNVVSIGLAAPIRLLFDLGGGGAAAPNGGQSGGGLFTPDNTPSNFPFGVDGAGKYWNNGKDGRAGTWFGNPNVAVDTEGNEVAGLLISFDSLTSGDFISPADYGMNYGGATVPVGDYPVSAVGDSYYIYRAYPANPSTPDQRNMTVTIPAGLTASIKFWGSRNNDTEDRILRVKKAEDPTYTQEMNTRMNVDFDEAITITNVTGTQVLNMEVKSPTRLTNIAVIDITLT